MSLIALAVPILPGKKEQWDRFIAEINGPRKAEFDASRARAGVHERTLLQQAPDGTYLVLVTLEGATGPVDVARVFDQDTAFARWFAEQVEEIHGFDPRRPMPGPLPHVIAESASIQEANKNVIRRFDEIMMTGNSDELDSVCAPEYVNYFPGSPQPLGLAATKEAVRAFQTAFPDLTIDVESLVAEDNTVVSRYTMTGTHRGAFQGIPATGRRFSIPGIAMWELKDGKIVRDWPGFSPLEMMVQLGVEAPAAV